MVDAQDAAEAAEALTMVVAGLAKAALELIALREPGSAAKDAGRVRQIADLGRDITLAATAAAMALDRAVEPSKGL